MCVCGEGGGGGGAGGVSRVGKVLAQENHWWLLFVTFLVRKFRNVILYFNPQSWRNTCKETVVLIIFSCILLINLDFVHVQPKSK